MTTETETPRSRRALLAAGAAAGVATVASALGRPSPTSAAIGPGEFASATVGIAAVSATHTLGSGIPAYGVYAESGSPGGTGVLGVASAATGTGVGVYGQSGGTFGRGVSGYADAATGTTYGVYAQSDSTGGLGVYGYAAATTGATRGVVGKSDSTDGVGVYGVASAATGTALGVYAQSDSTGGFGVFGYATAATGATRGVYGRAHSPDGTAVIGHSGTGSHLVPVPKTGVYGYAAQDAEARGVTGSTTTGRGVNGVATTGTAGYFATTTPGTGMALRAVGRVKLDNCSGVATVPVGQKTVVVTPGIDLVSSSAVVATLMGGAGGTTTVHRVAVNATANTFTIVLTKSNSAASPVKVAWHVFG